MISKHDLDRITGHTRYAARKAALCAMIEDVSPGVHDLRPPHELALFLSQVLHESAGLRYVREVWGPTAAQRRYEGRTDLGNTQKGDGKRFMGRDLIQVTGRYNYRALTQWLSDRIDDCPDFETDPDALERPDFLGWGALWYWATRIPRKYVEGGDIEMVTRRVNGGLNGYADRLRYYDRAALVLAGYAPDDVQGFQRANGLVQDGISGPRTRDMMHTVLQAMSAAPVFEPPRPDVEPPEETAQSPWAALLAAILAFLKK